MRFDVGKFDVTWPTVDAPWTDDAGFAHRVVDALSTKGYCLVNMCLTMQLQEAAMAAATDQPNFQLLRREMECAYLGEGNRSKVATLQDDVLSNTPLNALEYCDRQLSSVARLLWPLAPANLKFSAWGRSSGLVRVPMGDVVPEELANSDVEEGKVESLLSFLRMRKVSMLYTIQAGGGLVRLDPRVDLGGLAYETIKIPLSSGTLLLFRHDSMNYAYNPEGESLALQAWILTDPPSFKLNAAEISMRGREKVIARSPTSERYETHVVSASTQTTGGSGLSSLRCAAFFGGDFISEVPLTRYDIDLYYSSDADADMRGLSYTKHSAFLPSDVLENVDFRSFGITDEEAACMDPNQRIAMEVGYDVLFGLGHSEQSAVDRRIGLAVAQYPSEWPMISRFTGKNSYVGADPLFAASRLAYIFGLKGQARTIDTACSSSTVTTCLCHGNLIRGSVDAAISLASHTFVGPVGYVMLCSGGFLSRKGRCFTFNASADGFARGEGGGAVLFKLGSQNDEAEGVLTSLVGSCVNQDGRSASLSAPHGPSQSQCIQASLDMGGIKANKVSIAECHGTATALGDPIEVNAIMAVFKVRDFPLLETSVKSNFGHQEAAAGINGLMKCTLMLQSAVTAAVVHFRVLNPHMKLDGYPAVVPSDLCDCGRSSQVAGVSGFGVGGTNARADLCGLAQMGPRSIGKTILNSLNNYDFVHVACPRCSGPMCYLCGVAVPKYVAKRSKHHCSLIREDFAEYDYCSECYDGCYKFGRLPDYIRVEGESPSVVGSWSGWSDLQEMTKLASPGAYVFEVTLGPTRREEFYLVPPGGQDTSQAIYPVVGMSGPFSRVAGPDGDRKGRCFLIDGESDGASAGIVYSITLTHVSHKTNKCMTISWHPCESRLAKTMEVAAETHQYSMVSSSTLWNFQNMESRRDDHGFFFEAMLRIGSSGQEEFQVVRDEDWNQVIHPAIPSATSVCVPVRGPDDKGNGMNWQVCGKPGEDARVHLRAVRGRVSVTLTSETEGLKTWRSFHEERAYYIVGSFNGWNFSPMLLDEGIPGLYRMCLCIGDMSCEEFQVVIDEDWSRKLYPSVPNAESGGVFPQGPDDGGHGLNWLIFGKPGSEFVVVLDLNAEDRRQMITWSPLVAGGAF